MRYLFGFVCVLVLGVMGCSETSGTGGSGGDAGVGGIGGGGGDSGTGGMGGGGAGGVAECQSPEHCEDFNDCTGNACADGTCEYTPLADGAACDESNVCTTGMCTDGTCESTPLADGTECGDGAGICQAGSCVGTFACTEQGIRDAIAVGGGPHTFDCGGPTTVVTEAGIAIDNDVILDGEGTLTVEGNEGGGVALVEAEATAELRGFTVTRGRHLISFGRLTLTNSTVSGYIGGRSGEGAILSFGTLTLTNSTVSGNKAEFGGGGISSFGTLTLTNSTVSGNAGCGINSYSDTLTLTNSTVSGNTRCGIYHNQESTSVTVTNSIVEHGCERPVTSNGYNVESPGDTCGFGQPTDQPNVSAVGLKLGPLQDNGGPTTTHALLPGSVAIDHIPAIDCQVDTDQRGVARPQGTMCDVGAFELEVGP